MMEKLKSILLVTLIFTSLFQTYLLAYNRPNLDPILQSEYIETEILGEQKELTQLIHPQQVILNHGDETYSMLYPHSVFYNLIVNKLKEITFEGFVELNQSTVNWNTLRNEHKGVQIQFKEGLSIRVLEQLFEKQLLAIARSEYIDRIWLIHDGETERVRAFFFSVTGVRIYEATRMDLTIDEIRQFVNLGQYLPEYRMVDHRYYVPESEVYMVHYKTPYIQYTPEQLHKSLFADPSISRKILERDGTEIITDGKRGLRFDRLLSWMSYSDPVVTDNLTNDVRENIVGAIQFINRHGGWDGQYIMNHVRSNRDETIIFRQYINSYPIVSPDPAQFGYMKVSLQKGDVYSYERSLINLKHSPSIKAVEALPGGSELRELLHNYNGRRQIASLFLGYVPVMTEGSIELNPAWIIERMDGTLEVLE